MSLRKKLLQAASQAAMEATSKERGRCLWCLERLMEKVHDGVNKKLMAANEKHLAEVRYALAQALTAQLRMMISSGMEPPLKCELCDEEIEATVFHHDDYGAICMECKEQVG